MKLQIKDLEIYTYDKTDKDQRHLRYVLENDYDFLKYVTKNLENRLIETNPKEILQFNSSYLIKYKKDFIGYIRLGELQRNGSLSIECAVSPDYRNQKLGKKIIEILAQYLLDNRCEIQKLRGVIEKSNYASCKMALSAGFIEEKRDDQYIYVSKSR